jgi:hypothetical protein
LLQERRDTSLPLRIAGGYVHEHSNTPYPVGLLRAPCHWPRDHRAAEQSYELPAFHCLCFPRAAGYRIGLGPDWVKSIGPDAARTESKFRDAPIPDESLTPAMSHKQT